MGVLKAGKFSAWLSAILLCGSGIASWYLYAAKGPDIDGDKYKSMDVDELKDMWQFRRDKFGAIAAIGTCYAVGLLLLIPVGCALKRMFMCSKQEEEVFERYAKKHKMAPKCMKWCFVLGALFPVAMFLQGMGALCTGTKISGWSEFPDEDFPMLELSYVLSYARSIWVMALQFLFLSCGLFIAAKLTFKEKDHHRKKLPLVHAYFGLFTAFLGLVCFVMLILVFINYTKFVKPYAIVSFAWNSILLPIWLVMLGWKIGKNRAEWGRETEPLIPPTPPGSH